MFKRPGKGSRTGRPQPQRAIIKQAFDAETVICDSSSSNAGVKRLRKQSIEESVKRTRTDDGSVVTLIAIDDELTGQNGGAKEEVGSHSKRARKDVAIRESTMVVDHLIQEAENTKEDLGGQAQSPDLLQGDEEVIATHDPTRAHSGLLFKKGAVIIKKRPWASTAPEEHNVQASSIYQPRFVLRSMATPSRLGTSPQDGMANGPF